MIRKIAILAAAVIAATSFSVSAQTAQERSIQYRQGVMKAQGWQLGNMGAQIRGTKPYNKDDFAQSATFLSQLMHMSWDGFGPGTDKGAPTKARPEIWTDGTKFKAAGDNAIKATAALAQAAAAGNMDTIKAAFGEVGKACKGCHDDFQAK
jgi:cytochrome c556